MVRDGAGTNPTRLGEMKNTDSAIQALLDDLGDSLDIELKALGQEDAPYLLFVLTESRPHLCGMATPEALETAAKLLITMAAEARAGQPKAVLAVAGTSGPP